MHMDVKFMCGIKGRYDYRGTFHDTKISADFVLLGTQSFFICCFLRLYVADGTSDIS